MLGIVYSLLAGVGFGSTAVFAQLVLQHIRTTTVTLVSLVVSTAFTLVIALILHPREPFALGAPAYLWFLLAGVLTFPLGRLLNYTAVHLAGVSRSQPIIGASPLFATALAVMLGGETLNLPMLLGTVAIIGGLALILSQQ